MIGCGLLVAGASLGWALGTQRDDAGFFTTSNERFGTDSFALTSDKIDLGRPGRDDWWADRELATVRITVHNADARPVFVRIGPASNVEAYLAAARREARGGPVDESRRTSTASTRLATRWRPARSGESLGSAK